MDKFFYETWGYEKPISPQFIQSDKTLDDYKRLFDENELKGSKDWFNYYDNNRDDLLKEGFFKTPWVHFKITSKEFFDYILSREDIKRGIDDYKKLFIKSGFNGMIDWFKYYDDNKETLLNKGYIKTPWHTFKMSKKEFFDYVLEREDIKRDIDDYKELFKENNLKGIAEWKRFYNDNKKELSKQGYSKIPWKTFKISQKEFFDYVLEREDFTKLDLTENLIKEKVWEYYKIYNKWPTESSKEISFEDGTTWMRIAVCMRKGLRGLKKGGFFCILVVEVKKEKFGYKERSLNDYRKLFKENNLSGITDWFEYYSNDNYLNNIGYFKTPWQTFKMSQKEFFNYVLNREDVEKASEQEHIDFIKKNNIKGHAEYNKFKKPKCYYGKTDTLLKYFPNIQYELGWKFNLTLDDYKKLFQENNIEGGSEWFDYYDNNKEDLLNQGYYKYPWNGFKISSKDFFNYVLDRESFSKLGEQDHIDFIKSNNIKGVKEYVIFQKPKCYYSSIQMLEKHYPDIQYKLGWKFNLTLGDYKKLFLVNNLESKKDWFIYYNNNKDNLFNEGYVKYPWSSFKMSQKEFFDYVLDRK